MKVKVKTGPEFERITNALKEQELATVCQQSGCPNIWECFSRREATVMILGPVCTRSCGYCRISSGRPNAVDATEPERLAGLVASLGLNDIVITSVTRDDLDDGGAMIFVRSIAAVKERAPNCRIEVLIPDFGGGRRALEKVADSGPDVIGHNIETVARLFPKVRPEADYRLSITLLKRLAVAGVNVKSGMMVGLGETRAEIRATLEDVAAAGVKTITIGQYLSPSPKHWPVRRYYRPAEFMGLAKYAQSVGFKRIISGPLVRSSYRGLILTPISEAACSS